MSSVRNVNGRAGLVIVLLAMVLCVGLLALHWILNRPAIIDLLSREFEQRTGLSLSVEGWHVEFFPSIRLEMRGAHVHDGPNASPFFTADRLEVALGWLPLLEGRLVGKDVVLDRPRLTVRRSADRHWSIAGRTGVSSAVDPSPPVPFLQTVRNLLLVDGMVTVVDDSGLTPRLPTHIRVTQGTLSSELWGRHAKLQISGEIPQERDRAAFTWDGSLTQNQEGEGLQAEGDFRLHHIDVRHVLSSWAGGDALPDGLIGPAQLTAHLRWAPRGDGYDLIADEWRAELSDFSMQGTGAVAWLGAAPTHFSVTMSAAPMMLTRLLIQLPSVWIPVPLRAQLVDHQVDGLVTLQSLSLSGKVGSGTPPTLNGSIGLRNGHVTVGYHYPSVEALSATLSFDAEQIRLTDLRAQCGPMQLTGREVVITQWLHDPHLDVKLFGVGSLRGLVEAARRIEEVSLLRDVFARMQETTGDVEMVVHLEGQPAKGRRLSLVEADFNLNHVGFRSTVLQLLVEQVEAHLHASPNLVRVEHLEGRVGPARLEAQGDMTWTGTEVYSNVNVNMRAEASKVLSWLAEEADIGSRPEVEGHIDLNAAIIGTVEQPRFAGRIELESAGLHVPQVLTKPLHTPAAIEFDSRLSEGGLLTIRHIGLSVSPIKIVGDGTIRLLEDMAFAVNVSSDAISLSDLPVGIALGPIKAGTMSTQLHMEGLAKDRASWRTSGQVRFDRGIIAVESLDEPIRDAFVALRFDQDKIKIERMAFHVGASDLRVSGSIARWAESPQARLVVESSQIDVSAFGSSRRKSSASVQGRSSGKTWWSGGTVSAFFFADHVYYKKVLLTDLSGRVSWDHGLLTVERISGDTNEGHVGGQVKARAGTRRVEQARGTFHLNGIPAEHLLDLIQAKPFLTGWLKTSGTVQAEFEREGVVLSSLTSRRPIQIMIENGTMHNVPVIAKLLSVMNLPALLQGQVNLDKDGLPVDQFKLVFSLENGVIDVTELLVDSPVLKISGTGKYDIIADQFDMVLATSPLGSYSATLKRIPLFGHLIAGDRQGFDTAVFELKGSANHPDLRYLPSESLKTGVKGTAQLAFDILVNALTLPQKAYSMAEAGITGREDEDF